MDTSWITNLKDLKKLGDTKGRTVQKLNMLLGRSSKHKPCVPLNPAILIPFPSITHLTWRAHDDRLVFTPPPVGYSVLPRLEVLVIDGASPTLLDIGLQLPFTFLRDVEFTHNAEDVLSAVAFLQVHGSKLVRLGAGLEILVQSDVFHLCPNLEGLRVIDDLPMLKGPVEEDLLPEDFFAPSVPQARLAEIYFNYWTLCVCSTRTRFGALLMSLLSDPKLDPLFKRAFEHFNPVSFPLVQKISMTCIEWPTSEGQARKNRWLALSEVLRPKGVELTDGPGISWAGTRLGRNS
ncbi:hypothetical protein DFH06DRAFT_553497 [Mycena polygramma]|nr:hypothetical protein DFH06DRAFT_553497 [Mycena polygramma]